MLFAAVDLATPVCMNDDVVAVGDDDQFAVHE
jgi:hypothetical protein